MKKKVRDAGGLHVIGTERHESRRVDNQLRGRAGRQGDQDLPDSSYHLKIIFTYLWWRSSCWFNECISCGGGYAH